MGKSGGWQGCWGHWGLQMKNEDSLLQSTLENSRWSIADIGTLDVSTGGYIWLKCIWPQVYVTKVVTHIATWCLCLGRVRLTFCLIGSQPTSCNWPANQPCDKISTCQLLGWSDIWWQEDQEPNLIGLQSRVPVLPLVPLGKWPTWQRPGKWHKWALQSVIYIWHYI